MPTNVPIPLQRLSDRFGLPIEPNARKQRT